MSLGRIRLELTRTAAFPHGSSRHAYEFVAPITVDPSLETKRWIELKDRCEVVQFWGDEKPQSGVLRRIGTGWAFDSTARDNDDAAGSFDLDRHLLPPNACLSIRTRDEVHPFRVVSITPLPA